MLRRKLVYWGLGAKITKRTKRNRPMSTLATTLYSRSLELAAGVPVNAAAYEAAVTAGEMNLAKLQALGKAFRQGWLHNVLARITPLTTRETTDYTRMAALFIGSQTEAEALLNKLSADLSRFATLAGVIVQGQRVPQPLAQHLALYQAIAAQMEETFAIQAPKPFASATIDAAAQAEMAFVRQFVKETFVA